jgi:hypothetical protein
VRGAETEERASCVFARRVLDEKRRARACFAHISAPNPPPPPLTIVRDTTAAASLWRQRERLGDLEAYEAPRKTDIATWEENTAGAVAGTEALLDALGEENPILQGMLRTAKDEIAMAGVLGRRLMQRVEYATRMEEVLITHEIMSFYGKGGIPGVTSGSCEVQFTIKPRQTQTLHYVYTLQRCSALGCGDSIVRLNNWTTRILQKKMNINSGALRGYGAGGQCAPHRNLQGVWLQARSTLLVRRSHGLVLPAAGKTIHSNK